MESEVPVALKLLSRDDNDEAMQASQISQRKFAVEAGHTLFKRAPVCDSSQALIPLNKLIVVPWGKWYKIWWSFTVLCAFLTIFTETYNIAFSPAGLTTDSSGPLIVELCLVGIFVIDIFVSFNLAYYNKANEIVMDHKKIAYHYLRFMFWVDMVGVFPFYAIALWIAGDMGQDSKLTQYLSLLQLVRFVRLHRMFLVFEILQYSTKISLMSSTLARNLTAAVVWCHCHACAFYFIARIHDFDPETTWLGDTSGMSALDLYMTSLYFTVVTFTTVGYGDYSPGNTAEKIWDILFMLTNIIFVSWLIGSMTLLVVKTDEKTGMYRDFLETLKKFSEVHGLDKDFHKGLKSNLKLEFNNREINEEEILSRFPTAVRRKVLRKIYLPDLIRTRLVRGLPSQVLDAILSASKVEIISAGEDLLNRGSVASDLYFLVDGTVKLIPDSDEDKSKAGFRRQASINRRASGVSGAPASSTADSELRAHGHKLLELQSGQFINEISFLTESPQRETIRTKTVCRTLTLSRDNFKVIAADYPELVTTLLNNLLDNVERMRIFESNTATAKRDDSDEYAEEVQNHLRSVRQESDLLAIQELISGHINKLKDEAVTEFLFAASRGDTSTVGRMCENGFHPDTTDYDLRTALMISSMKGHTSTVIKLLEYHADPNKMDMHGSSALFEAATNGHNRTVEVLLQKGAELCLTEGQAASKLCRVVFDGDMTMFRRLLNARINPDATDYDRRTASHIAASEGNLQALKILAEYGANVLTVRDRWNNSVEDEARKSKSAEEMLDFLKTLKNSEK